MDGLGSASPPVAPTATTGEGRHPCTWPRTFWFKPLSAFGLLDLTTFISSSPELAMPSTLAPNRLSASSRRALSREARPPWVGEVTLSQELRTARSPRPHVLVGYQWSHTGLRPGRKTSHNRYIRSFVSHPPTDPDLRLIKPPLSQCLIPDPGRMDIGGQDLKTDNLLHDDVCSADLLERESAMSFHSRRRSRPSAQTTHRPRGGTCRERTQPFIAQMRSLSTGI